MDVGDWLLRIGLGQYEALFRESEIDAEVLSELSEVDFEKIGIPLGHRKRLLKRLPIWTRRGRPQSNPQPPQLPCRSPRLRDNPVPSNPPNAGT